MKIILSSTVLAAVVAPVVCLSYLDSLSPSNPVSYSRGGFPSNGASYLDALNSPVSRAPTGSGMTSYLDSVASGPVGTAVAAEPAPVVAEAAVPVVSAPPVSAAPAGASYLDSLSKGTAAVRGPGLTTYLDTVPRNQPARGGPGIESYKDALPVTNTVTGTGAGLNTYTDNLSGGSKPSKSYAPFGGSTKASFRPSFSGSTSGSDIGFTLEASDLSELVRNMSGAGTIRLSGSIESVSFH